MAEGYNEKSGFGKMRALAASQTQNHPENHYRILSRQYTFYHRNVSHFG